MSRMHQNAFIVAGLCPDPLWELNTLPQTPSVLRGALRGPGGNAARRLVEDCASGPHHQKGWTALS